MPIDAHPRRAEEIVAQQRQDAAKERARAINARRETATNVPAKSSAGTAVAAPPPDTRSEIQRYVDEIAPSGITGRLIKFGKGGVFCTADDGEPVPESADFLALCGEVLIGWIKFSRDDTPPQRICGLLYGGFILPGRSTLDDADETQWEPGLDGQPSDPWRHQILLPLQDTETKELFTFGTTSTSGRRSVGALLRHFDRMSRTNSGEVPIVRLRSSGFNHRDPRVGWVATPQFAIVGRAPRDSAARPDTSVAADLSDSIPF